MTDHSFDGRHSVQFVSNHLTLRIFLIKGRYKDALRQVEEILKQKGTEREIQQIEYLTLLLLKGHALFNLGNVQESLEVVDHVLQVLDDPDSLRAIEEATTKSGQAEGVQRAALHVEALLQRGNILSCLGKRKETESLLQRVETLLLNSRHSEVFKRSFAREESLEENVVMGAFVLPVFFPVLLYMARATEFWLQHSADKAMKAHDNGLCLLEDICRKETENGWFQLYCQQLLAGFLSVKGNICWTTGDLDEALMLHQQSLAMREVIGNPRSIATSLNNLGTIHHAKGNLDEALQLFTRALQLWESVGNPGDVARALGNIAVIFARKGQLDEALEYHERALELWRKIGSERTIAWTLQSMGIIYSDKGELDRALECYGKALESWKKDGNDRYVGWTLHSIGLVHARKGNMERALSYYQQSLGLLERAGNPQHLAQLFNNMSEVYRYRGELDLALKCQHRSLETWRKVGNPLFLADALRKLGLIHHECGNWSRALSYLKQSLELRQQIGDPLWLSATLFDLIRISLLHDPSVRDIYQYMDELARCVVLQPFNETIKQRLQACKALVLLHDSQKLTRRERIQARLKAEQFLEDVSNDSKGNHEVVLVALLELCRHFAEEMELTSDPELLMRVHEILTRLLEISKQQRSYWLVTETYWIKAKIALIEGDLVSARKFLMQAQLIAEEKGLHRLSQLISNDHDELLILLDQWGFLASDELSLVQRIKMTRLDALVEQISRRRVVDMFGHSVTRPEPVILLVIAESGILLYSRSFSSGMTGETELISGFLRAIHSFSKAAFGSDLDRMRIGDYTIVVMAEEQLLMAYVCKGPSYGALQQLKTFKDIISESSPSLQEQLTRTIQFGEKISKDVIRSLDDVVDSVFLS